MTRPINSDLDIQTLDCIKQFIAERQYPPSRRDLRKCLGVSSISTVQRRVTRLVEAGLIVVEAGPRAIRIVNDVN